MWQPGHAWDAAWTARAPFPYAVVDDFFPADQVARLMAILDEEHVERYEGDLFAFEASAPEPATPELRAFRDAFAAALAPRLSRLAGTALRRADLRAYAYRVGHYLLPHTDHQDELGRALAYAYYLPSPEPPIGGELELFRFRGEVPESATLIEPRANRIAIFEVGDTSLHQVREVLRGLRISIAGWFYPREPRG